MNNSKQSLKRIIDYSDYTDFNEFVADVTMYVHRIAAIVKKYNTGYTNDLRCNKLLRLGCDVGHLPFTVFGNTKSQQSDREQTKQRLQQYLPKKITMVRAFLGKHPIEIPLEMAKKVLNIQRIIKEQKTTN